MTKTLILMRGLPGSGKSTRAAELQPDLRMHCSADHFYMVNGEYKFDINLRSIAHGLCFAKARLLMNAGCSPVVIDNTNCQKSDYEKYVRLAEELDYKVQFETPKTDWAWDVDECFKRNTHNVPREIIANMKNNYLFHK